MEIPEKAKRRLEIEKQLFELQSELGSIHYGKCDHVIEKGRLCYSNLDSKIIQTHEHRQQLKSKLPNMDDCVMMYCQICDRKFGWYCPVNPNRYCEYDMEHGENCIHCGDPDERK